MAKVKICGVTIYDDAMLVTNIGAEYVGFNFYKESPRKISSKNAKDIISKLPPFITPVGVFVNEDKEVLKKTAKKCGIKMLQLHGDESPEYCLEAASETSLPVIKAFRIKDESSLEQINAYKDVVNYFLLDTYVPGEPGGTGEVFNWDLAVKVKELNKPIFLAGGLNPDNVASAIEKVQPYAVDVSSGVERLTRRKDFDKVSKFVRGARGLK
ncbi:phosphoribosylanthranilate isomerase [Elusimicrobiota bacterium]